MDVTVFELHLPEAQFNAPFAGSDTAAEPDAERAEAEPTESSGGSGGSALRPVVALLVLAGLAALAWYLRRPADDAGIEAVPDGE